MPADARAFAIFDDGELESPSNDNKKDMPVRQGSHEDQVSLGQLHPVACGNMVHASVVPYGASGAHSDGSGGNSVCGSQAGPAIHVLHVA